MSPITASCGIRSFGTVARCNASARSKCVAALSRSWFVIIVMALLATGAIHVGQRRARDFRSMLLRYTSEDGGETIDPGSEEVVMSIERVPYGVHQGGKIAFASDGMLWISTGDGDGYGDPHLGAVRRRSTASCRDREDAVDVRRGSGR